MILQEAHQRRDELGLARGDPREGVVDALAPVVDGELLEVLDDARQTGRELVARVAGLELDRYLVLADEEVVLTPCRREPVAASPALVVATSFPAP